MTRPLGKAPKRHDPRTLRLSRYDRGLAPPPPSVDHCGRMPRNPGMMGNDRYGDCVVASFGHALQSWTAYARTTPLTPPDSELIASYLRQSPGDAGLVMIDALNDWRRYKLGGDTLEAYVELGVANLTQLRQAIHLFGVAVIGMSLPDDGTFGPWTVPTGAPSQYNGHAVALVAYDGDTFTAVSWGEYMPVSSPWLQRYMDEGYAPLDDISLLSSGLSPAGFDLAQLRADLDALGGVVDGPPPPPPSCWARLIAWLERAWAWFLGVFE